MSKAKSFYIFDFDDNIIHTQSSTYIYHKETDQEITLTSHEYVANRILVGKTGPYKDYYIDTSAGRSFRRFGDNPDPTKNTFLEDLKNSLEQPDWKGPSWDRFVKAVSLERTMSVITARGHNPEKIREGIAWLAEVGHIPKVPDIHSIYAVTSAQTKKQIRWTGPDLISPLKKQAMHHFIENVYQEFGHKPAHRFGYSDDDPKNIVTTRQKFRDLKQRNPHHCFFLYEARPSEVISEEVEMSHDEIH